MLLTLPARSVSWREAMVSFSLGLSGAFILTLGLEYAFAVWAAAEEPNGFRQSAPAASYRLDPVIEEGIKLLPLALLLLWASIRQRLNMTDIIVLAGTIGAGFGLAEAALTISSALTVGEAFGRYVDGFYQFSTAGAGVSNIAVPGVWLTLTSWLPDGLFPVPFGDPDVLSKHVTYSLFAGAGLAILIRARKLAPLGIAFLTYSALAHAANNAKASNAELPFGLSTAIDAMQPYDGQFLLVMVASFVAVDAIRLRRSLIAQSAVQVAVLPRLFAVNLFRRRGLAALWAFVLERRAFLNAAGVSGAGSRHDALRERTEALASALRGDPVNALEADPSHVTSKFMRRFVTAVMVLVAVPTVIFAALIGWEDVQGSWLYDEARPSTETAWLALIYAQPIVFKALLGLLAISVVFQVGSVAVHLRKLWGTAAGQMAHMRLGSGLSVLAAIGGAALGLTALYTTFGGMDPLAIMHTHALERWLNANPLAAILLAIAAAVLTVMIPLAVATFLPRLSAVMGIIQAVTGIDAATGQKLTFLERVLGTIGLRTDRSSAKIKRVSPREAFADASFKPSWSETSKLKPLWNAEAHSIKHLDEFPELNTKSQYFRAAVSFVSNPPVGTSIKYRANGDILNYHEGSNIFVASTSDGRPKTMFKPNDGVEYWRRQK